MAAIAHHPLPTTTTAIWPEVVRVTTEWAASRKVDCRDLILLVPFAQLLPLARRAFGGGIGWMPRIETTDSLARSLGPADPPAHGQPSFDFALDRLTVRRILEGQGWAKNWARSEPRSFSRAVDDVVRTAHVLARAAFAVPPSLREAHWECARASLTLRPIEPGSPGSRERLLTRIALEWAACAAAPVTDALFGLRPSGWVVLQAGGSAALTDRLLTHACDAVPCLRIDTDAALQFPFTEIDTAQRISHATCKDFEDEAQRSAASILHHLERGDVPLALIAQDRLLVRRVRALLARHNVPIRDETGWKLATTRAGASVIAVLRCVRQDSTTDDWLDWLKACSASPHDGPRPTAGLPDALESLELELRRLKQRWAIRVDSDRLAPPAARLWRAAQRVLLPLTLPLTDAQRLPCGSWLDALATVLQASGQLTSLASDDAGRQVLAALRMSAGVQSKDEPGLAESLDFDAFVGWIDAVLEDVSFLPESTQDAVVVITPMARAMLRPFAVVVLPGADERHLGPVPQPEALLDDRDAATFGVPDRRMRQEAEFLAFRQLLRIPNLCVLHRASDDGEPRAPSPWVELLALSLARSKSHAWVDAPDFRTLRAVPPAPFARPLPRAPHRLPARLSASACEALRACPYRFFALRMLGLASTDELDADIEKRDYGDWLHLVLQRFHAERGEPASADADATQLHQIAQSVLATRGHDEADFLPYSATFQRLVPAYVRWLHRRDAEGAKWLDAERRFTTHPPEWDGIEMTGVIDRVDVIEGKEGAVTQLIDYKTGQSQPLREAIRQGEDTQLAIYAALTAAQGEGPGDLAAMYLMLDEGDRVAELDHPDVLDSARDLVAGVGHDLRRIRAGGALPALGEGRVCDHCDARGLCRRDHWPSPVRGAQ